MMMSRTMKMCSSMRTPVAEVGQPQVVVDRDERRRPAADRVEQRHELGHRGHLHGPRGVEPESATDGDADDDDQPRRHGEAAAARRRTRIRTAVATTAIVMPAADTRLPLRAVAGEFIRDRPMTNPTAPTSQAIRTRISTISRVVTSRPPRRRPASARARLLAEHLEHPVGDDVAADDVHRREGHGDEREELAERLGRAQRDEHRADEDDPVDRVRARHQRRMERRRDLRDHGEPDEDREREDRQRGEQRVDLFGGHAWPPVVGAAGAGSSSFFTASATTAPSCVMTVAFVTSSSKSRFSSPSLTIPSSSAEMLRA